MHEMSIAESVLGSWRTARAARFARREGGAAGDRALAPVEIEALRFCFDAVVRGSLAEGARLAIDEPPGTGLVLRLRHPGALARRGEACPRCGGHQLQVITADEMRVKESRSPEAAAHNEGEESCA